MSVHADEPNGVNDRWIYTDAASEIQPTRPKAQVDFAPKKPTKKA